MKSMNNAENRECSRSILLEKHDEPQKTAESLLQGKHILLAEDHLLNAEITTRLFGIMGLTVHCVHNGKEALDAFSSSQEFFYDAVFLDIRMPVMDGYVASKQIRALARPDAEIVPIIALTASAESEQSFLTVQAGTNAYIVKPIERESLSKLLIEQIQKRKRVR